MRLFVGKIENYFVVVLFSLQLFLYALIGFKAEAFARWWTRISEISKTAFKGQTYGFWVVQVIDCKTVRRQEDAVSAS